VWYRFRPDVITGFLLSYPMEFIVLFNSTTRDPILMTDDHGFVETFSTFEKAHEWATAQIDGKDFRDFQIYEATNG